LRHADKVRRRDRLVVVLEAVIPRDDGGPIPGPTYAYGATEKLAPGGDDSEQSGS
jgi:hypothetical protein